MSGIRWSYATRYASLSRKGINLFTLAILILTLLPAQSGAQSTLKAWRLLTPTQSSRYVALHAPIGGPDPNDALTPANMISSSMPVNRSQYSYPVYGNGQILYFGGGHGDYPGNDVEVFDILGNVWAQSYRPNSINEGGGGGSEYAWVDPLTGNIRPYQIHGYGRVSFDKSTNRMAVLASFWPPNQITRNGTQYVPPSGLAPFSYIQYDPVTKLWAYVRDMSAFAITGGYNHLTQYDEKNGGILLISPQSGYSAVYLLKSDGSTDGPHNTNTQMTYSGVSSFSVYVPDGGYHIIARVSEGSNIGKLFQYTFKGQPVDMAAYIPPELQRKLNNDANFFMSYDRLQKKLLGFTVDTDNNPAGTGLLRTWVCDLTQNGGLGAWTKLPLDGSEPRLATWDSSFGRAPIQYDDIHAQHILVAPDYTGTLRMWRYCYSGSTVPVPTKTWTVRATQSGTAMSGSFKHIRLAYSTANHGIYKVGGDHDAWPGSPGSPGSGRQEVESYATLSDQWILEYPYCGYTGDVEPRNPDENGLAYDSTRNVIWLAGGATPYNVCSSGATLISNRLMSFDPTSKKWTDYGYPLNPYVIAGNKFLNYDPITDRLYQFGWNGSNGMAIFDLATKTWLPWVSLSHDETGIYTNNANDDVSGNYAAIDVKSRFIYAVASSGWLYRYNIMTAKWRRLIATPVSPATPDATNQVLVFDSTNNVLFWIRVGDTNFFATLYIYHPDTNTWETDQKYWQQDDPANPQYVPRDPANPIRINTAIYDPSQNLMIAGGALWQGGADSSITHYFIYRYGGLTRPVAPKLKTSTVSP